MEKVKVFKKMIGQTFCDIRQKPSAVVYHLLVLVSAFTLGQGIVFSGLSPFALSFLCAVPPTYSFAALAGVCLGYLANQTGAMLIRYIATAIALWVVSSRILKLFSKYNEIWFLLPLISFGITFCTGVAVVIPQGITLNAVWIFFCEAILCGGCTYFLKRTFAIKNVRTREIRLSHQELACVIASIGIFLTALSVIQFKNISPARIAASFLILICGYFAKEAGGSIVGIACAVSLSFTSKTPYTAFSYAFGGLLCGVFSSLGRLGCAMSYVGAVSVVFIMSGGDINIALLLFECIAASFVFLLIPMKYINKFEKYFNITFRSFGSENIKRNIADKLTAASETVKSISEDVVKVSEGLKRIHYNDEKTVYCRVQDEVCSHCLHYDKCWEANFTPTLQNFDYITNVLNEKGTVSTADIPEQFAGQCEKINALIPSFQNNYKQYLIKTEEEKDTNNLRNMLSDQLDCMSEVFLSFANDFKRETITDYEMTGQVRAIFKKHNIDVIKIACLIHAKGQMTIESECRKIEKGLNKEALTKEIEAITLRKFELPVISFLESGISIVMEQKPWMNLNIGSMQFPSEGATICGDYFESFSSDNGKKTIILSDGMGTGGRAAVDAAMAAEFLSALSMAGFSFSSALKVVNATLLVKSPYESLSTVDVANVDLFTGQVEFYKAGAAVSFVRKNGKCYRIEGVSLPTGILREVSFAKENITLSAGDILVMVSDGVTDSGTDWIEEEIENWKYNNPQKLAQKIACLATEKVKDSKHDDITVIAGMVS